MRNARLPGLLATLLVGAWIASAAESPLSRARSTLGEWVRARKTLAATRADWAADKATLEQTAALLERELAGIREQQAQVQTNHASVEAQRQALAEQQVLYQAGLDAVRARVTELEARVRRLEPLYPPALKSTVQPLLNRLPADPAATNVALLPRVQALVTLLNEVDKFHLAFSVAEETRPGPDGRELAVEVLYAGLAQAWFVNKAGDFAGVGVPTADGWQWTARNELAPLIARALRMYRNELPAEFVSLPVQLP